MVTPETTELLVVIYAPREVPRAHVERAMSATEDRLALITGGSRAGSSVLDDQDRV
jgi:DNA/RNA-binding domain of Phe-tRNA-synthetase-like protein